MKRFFLIGIYFLLFFSSDYCGAQSYIYEANMLTRDDGLANLSTSTIYKDKKGFLWIGTRFGLNRYDGYSFKLYDRENSGLSSNHRIYSIREDENGNLWVFFNYKDENFIEIFNPQSEKAIPLKQYYEKPLPFSKIRIPKVKDPKKRIWIYTFAGELFLFKEGQFEKMANLPAVMITQIVIDEQENIWLGGLNAIYKINPKGQVEEHIKLPGKLSRLWVEDGHKLWFTIHKKRECQIFSKDSFGIVPLELIKSNQTLNSFQAAVRGPNGFWYVNAGPNLYLFDADGKYLIHFNELLNEEDKVLFIDYTYSTDRVWFATHGGVLKTKVKDNPFYAIKENDDFFDFRAITEDELGNIYFLATNLHKWNPKTNELKKIFNLEVSGDIVYYNNSIWASTYDKNILGVQLDLKSNQYTSYPVTYGFQVNSLLESSVPGIFFLGHNEGMSRLDLNEQCVLAFDQYNDFELLKSVKIRFLHESLGNIWIASNKGVFLMSEKEGVLQQFNTSSGDLPYDIITHIYEDKLGVFWLATAGGGLIQWKPKLSESGKSEYKQFTIHDGLVDNYLYAIYEDEYNKLWIPTNLGLMSIDKHTFQVRSYTKEDGLLHNEFNYTSHYQAKDGSLYFGGLGGLITFHPRDFAKRRQVFENPPLELVSFQVLKEGAANLQDYTSSLLETGEIIMRPTDKLFNIEFSLLDFDSPKQHRYAYKIEGYNENWIFIEENHIQITHLPYGNYVIKIKGQNKGDNWSNKELALAIHVLKPFYLQNWFIVCTIISLLGMIFFIFRMRTRKLRLDRQRLEKEVQNRTQKIAEQTEALKTLDKAKTRFFTNITHEFRTPLTLIQGPAKQLLEGEMPKVIQTKAQLIYRNATHLLSLINQLLDLSKLEKGITTIERTHGDIVAFTKQLVEAFQALAQKQSIDLQFKTSIKEWEMDFDKGKWGKIVNNLLSNAVKFTPEGGLIIIALYSVEKPNSYFIQLEVTDNGQGIEADHLPHIFDRFYQADTSSTRLQEGTGIGLALIKELVDIQNGDIAVESTLGFGTQFKISLPTLKANKPVFLNSEKEVAISVLPDGIPESKSESVLMDEQLSDSILTLLIVEDNADMRMYIRSCIDATQYEILEAADGEEGLNKALEVIPDLIISDVMMPKKNGFDLTFEIRNHWATSHIPLILLTAKASLESKLQGLERGADAYLTKPFSPEELFIRIQKLIAIRQRLQERYKNESVNIDLSSSKLNFQKEDNFITQIKSFILDNLDNQQLNVDLIGQQFAISRMQLYRKLRALTNQPVANFIRSIRLKKAKELLLQKELNIAEVAYRTGFSSPSHFTRTFKKEFGIPPSQL